MASAGASSQSKEISTEFSKYYLALCPELRKLVMDHYIGAMGGLEPRIVEVRFDHPITETFTPTPLPEAVRNLLVVSIETRAMVERDYPLAFQIGGHGTIRFNYNIDTAFFAIQRWDNGLNYANPPDRAARMMARADIARVTRLAIDRDFFEKLFEIFEDRKAVSVADSAAIRAIRMLPAFPHLKRLHVIKVKTGGAWGEPWHTQHCDCEDCEQYWADTEENDAAGFRAANEYEVVDEDIDAGYGELMKETRELLVARGREWEVPKLEYGVKE